MASSLARFFGYISGERRGPLAAAVRASLSVLSAPYWAACSTRLALYHWGLLACRELDARVISVGNITTGGTGKTPLVVWIARWLVGRGVRAAILSRGYGEKRVPPEGGTANAGESDEMLLFRRQVPGVPHVVDGSRYAGGLRAIAEHGAECLVLDDGFQHLALGRDLDIVAVDTLLPFGYGHLLPRGLLREPLSGLRRADIVVLTRCDLAAKGQVQDVERQVRRWCPGRPVVESVHRPVHFCCHGTTGTRPLSWVHGRKVFAFSALGNPAAFPRTLEALGAQVLRHEPFRDHHWYSGEDLAALARRAAEAGAEAVVTTEKDAVKIHAFPDTGPPLHALAVELVVTRGEDLLQAALDRVVKR
ncbi:MAG TPA: tetraacyldisaccharide 4'-kinase [Planctomycetota bacterium]|nr:tetraacyldisaccharide 4'-kinase [Planctomycetota bacterium]